MKLLAVLLETAVEPAPGPSNEEIASQVEAAMREVLPKWVGKLTVTPASATSIAPMITIRIVLEPQKFWQSGIWMNASHAVIALHVRPNGMIQLSLLTKSDLPKLVGRTANQQRITAHLVNWIRSAPFQERLRHIEKFLQ